MDDNNWYSPLNREEDKAPGAETRRAPEEKTVKRKRRTRKVRIGAIVVLALLLIAGSSLAFRNSSGSVTVNGNTFSFGAGKGEDKDDGFSFNFGPGDSDGESSDMPDNFRDFFKNFYTETTDDSIEVNIPLIKYSGSSKIEIDKAAGEELSLQELYTRSIPSVVAITGYVDGITGYYWGTGIVLSQDGLILTNAHVIEGCDTATVTLSDDTEYEAQLIGADGISDIAVLKIDAKGLTPARIGPSSELQVGDKVAAIGNPLGESFRLTLTDGIVSAIDRDMSSNGHSMTLIQTNTALNSGNSGGALYDMYGRVVGITNMKMMSSYSSIEGIGFAIPSDTAVKVADALIAEGEVRGRPSIGITVGQIPDNAKEKYEMPDGLYVTDVCAGSDAEKKGIQEGDVLVEVNGTPVVTTSDVTAVKDKLQVGDTISLKIWREGKIFTVNVILVDTNDIYGK